MTDKLVSLLHLRWHRPIIKVRRNNYRFPVDVVLLPKLGIRAS